MNNSEKGFQKNTHKNFKFEELHSIEKKIKKVSDYNRYRE